MKRQRGQLKTNGGRQVGGAKGVRTHAVRNSFYLSRAVSKETRTLGTVGHKEVRIRVYHETASEERA